MNNNLTNPERVSLEKLGVEISVDVPHDDGVHLVLVRGLATNVVETVVATAPPSELSALGVGVDKSTVLELSDPEESLHLRVSLYHSETTGGGLTLDLRVDERFHTRYTRGGILCIGSRLDEVGIVSSFSVELAPLVG